MIDEAEDSIWECQRRKLRIGSSADTKLTGDWLILQGRAAEEGVLAAFCSSFGFGFVRVGPERKRDKQVKLTRQ